MSDPFDPRVPGLLGPIFEEAGTGDRQMREALFLTFNVDLGFFETRLLGPIRGTGAAVTVVADGAIFAPDPRNVRSAGHSYAFGIAAMPAAFHPKLSVLVGPQRALVGIGSGNLTIGGWHGNNEVLTVIRGSRDEGAPQILGDVVRLLRDLSDRITISPLAAAGVIRTADQLAALIDAAEPIETEHRLVDSVQGTILDQLPDDRADQLELTAPFHDLGAKALSALIDKYRPQRVSVLAQPGQAVMDPRAMQQVASAAGCQLMFTQLEGEESTPSRYRHGKVITAFRHGAAVWTVAGSPNISAAALLRRAPSGNCEVGLLHLGGRSLLPTPTVPVADVPALLNTIGHADDESRPVVTHSAVRLLEARAVEGGVEVVLSGPAPENVLAEVSPFTASPDNFDELGVVPKGSSSAVFPGWFTAGTRVRVGAQLQFLAFADQVIKRLPPSGAGRPNYDSTVVEIFSSEVAAAQWHDALTRLLLSHGNAGRAGVAPPTAGSAPSPTMNWRTLDDGDTWAEYADDALTRLGMPILQLALGSGSTSKPAGNALPNSAPAWEDRFEETSEAFEEGETVETVEQLPGDAEPLGTRVLSPYARSRLRTWMNDIVGLMPQLGPLERIAVCQLAISGSSALIWDTIAGPAGWFEPLARALEAMNADTWPTAATDQAAAVSTVGLYRLRMAVPLDERGPEADRFFDIARSLSALTNTAPRESIADNLELLAGASIVAPSADDVVWELSSATSADPRDALIRVVGRILPEFEAAWVGDRRLLLVGRATNPKAIAATVLREAEAMPAIAVGVNATNGSWVVVGRLSQKLTLIEGGKRRTTFKTYHTQATNPVVVLTDQDAAQSSRVSIPPWTEPGDVDLEVLEALDLDSGPITP